MKAKETKAIHSGRRRYLLGHQLDHSLHIGKHVVVIEHSLHGWPMTLAVAVSLQVEHVARKPSGSQRLTKSTQRGARGVPSHSVLEQHLLPANSPLSQINVEMNAERIKTHTAPLGAEPAGSHLR